MYKEGVIEKRRFPRLDCSMPVQYKRIGSDDEDFSQTLTRDISEGGIRMIVEEYVPINSRITLIASFPFKNKKVKAFSKIVWSKRHSVQTSYELGVEFIGITTTARKDIAQFVKTKL
jgi:c-di-GMP-binding flagellar brake protein YcgR